jgi:hypothetical protein
MIFSEMIFDEMKSPAFIIADRRALENRGEART